ncbi:fatty acid desaturase family protein [Rhodopila sp.]|uniref:fatty acid desaturase family protein n=1 Tax=Rhodopila sp. TaxID=2480087 RepID=UPI003D1165A7
MNGQPSPHRHDRPEPDRGAMLARLAAYQTPSAGRSVAQLGITAAPYAALLGLMYYAYYHLSPWLSLALAVPAAGLVVRLFIIQHDCGHGAYFRSRWANETVGWLCGLTTFTPYALWRRHHAMHHAVWNNLDKRPSGGDIYSGCLTLAEYEAFSPWRRWLYRVALHPLVSQLLLPPVVFILLYRIPLDAPRGWRKERISVWLTNLGIGGFLLTLTLLLGWQPVLVVQLPVITLASIIGVWLFSVQHRFEHTLWARQTEWTAAGAALYGSSWLRLPKVLQWFTGNIGFHHVHHLMPRVPNYRLQAAHRADPAFAAHVTGLTLWQALRAPSFTLWDEARGAMVRFPRNLGAGRRRAGVSGG